jgi:DNA-binding GntR family transcriptional regulator
MYLARYDEDLAQRKGVTLDLINGKQDWNSLFHKEFYDAADNTLLHSYINNLRDLEQLKRLSLNLTLKDFRAFQSQHYKILDAVKQRNKNKAQNAVQDHIKTLYRFYYQLP